jgi:hypothetical protein
MINSICVSFIPDILLDSFLDEGDFPFFAFRWAAKFEDSTAISRERIRIEQTYDSKSIDIGFGDHSFKCNKTIWIDLPASLSYDEAKEIGERASSFVRGWVLGKLSTIPNCEYCGNQCTDDNGCDAHISGGDSAAASVECK